MITSDKNLFNVVGDYINRMIADDGSMKVLLLDEDTLGLVSLAFSQTQLLRKGVFLVDRVDNKNIANRGKMPTMRCCVFVRPTPRSIEALCGEIKASRYSAYHVVFANAVTTDTLDVLARADVGNLVSHVEEFFCDFAVVNGDAFLLPLHPNNQLSSSVTSSSQFLRIAEGLASTMLALRRRPFIRFQKSSPFARRVAMELAGILQNDPELYAFKPKDCVMLISDRNDDPITPLLTPWTYQAMLHDLVGIQSNRLRLPETSAEEEEYCFSQNDDSFFSSNMFNNWGDLCNNVKQYVDQCKATLNIDKSTATMEEIKQFMQKLPQTKSLTGSVTKHATVVSHLSSVIKARSLLDVSLLEQDMVSSVNSSEHLSRLAELAKRSDIDRQDVLRLCLVYNMRYEKFGQPSRVEELLQGVDERLMLRKLREYYGDRSVDVLFASSGMMASIVKTFSDVGNIYTQHEPALKKVLHSLITGKLESEQYPFAPCTPPPTGSVVRPKEVIVFMCGGMTYSEAAMVSGINKGTTFSAGSLTLSPAAAADIRVLLGGTDVLNSKQFLDQLSHVA